MDDCDGSSVLLQRIAPESGTLIPANSVIELVGRGFDLEILVDGEPHDYAVVEELRTGSFLASDDGRLVIRLTPAPNVGQEITLRATWEQNAGEETVKVVSYTVAPDDKTPPAPPNPSDLWITYRDYYYSDGCDGLTEYVNAYQLEGTAPGPREGEAVHLYRFQVLAEDTMEDLGGGWMWGYPVDDAGRVSLWARWHYGDGEAAKSVCFQITPMDYAGNVGEPSEPKCGIYLARHTGQDQTSPFDVRWHSDDVLEKDACPVALTDTLPSPVTDGRSESPDGGMPSSRDGGQQGEDGGSEPRSDGGKMGSGDEDSGVRNPRDNHDSCAASAIGTRGSASLATTAALGLMTILRLRRPRRRRGSAQHPL